MLLLRSKFDRGSRMSFALLDYCPLMSSEGTLSWFMATVCTGTGTWHAVLLVVLSFVVVMLEGQVLARRQ